jgi:hypothetical protein
VSEMHQVRFVLRQGVELTTSLDGEAIKQMQGVLNKAWSGVADNVMNIIGMNNTAMIRPSEVCMVDIQGWKP